MGVFPPPASPVHRVADGEPFEKVLGSSENECKEKRSEDPAPGNVSAGQSEADAAGTTRDMVAEALCSSSTPLDLKMGSAIPHSLAIPCSHMPHSPHFSETGLPSLPFSPQGSFWEPYPQVKGKGRGKGGWNTWYASQGWGDDEEWPSP